MLSSMRMNSHILRCLKLSLPSPLLKFLDLYWLTHYLFMKKRTSMSVRNSLEQVDNTHVPMPSLPICVASPPVSVLVNSHRMTTRSKNEISRPRAYQVIKNCGPNEFTPSTVVEALRFPTWKDAMKECWGKFIRVKVQIDISKPLKRWLSLKMGKSDEIVVVGLKYERLSNFCYACGRIGHVIKECTDEEAKKRALDGASPKFRQWLKAVGTERMWPRVQGTISGSSSDRDRSSYKDIKISRDRFHNLRSGSLGPAQNKADDRQKEKLKEPVSEDQMVTETHEQQSTLKKKLPRNGIERRGEGIRNSL
ncbi:hypothetical protein EZV62_004566 [Acer yangbiense]|uniref:CCHC-type domain-containing protein n=1 Tax=Acer yangbiense TaxID=1000413 RepID=A0A5C7IK95_9ROSI|nr:hypothetical protein EZV62_004566 [Acer yangbiense]